MRARTALCRGGEAAAARGGSARRSDPDEVSDRLHGRDPDDIQRDPVERPDSSRAVGRVAGVHQGFRRCSLATELRHRYGNADGSRPTLIPFDLAPSFSTVPGQNLYDGPPTWTPPEPPSRFLPLLAQYWQSWKDTGHAPAHTVFVPGGYTTVVGQGLATPRQGSMHLGFRQTFRFSADPAAGQWEFSVAGSVPMVCGAIVDKVTSTAVNGKGLMQQNPDERNYGIPLAPGVYKQTTLYLDHETCVQPVSNGLDVTGNVSYSSNSTGILANPAVQDFQTNVGVLATDIAQHEQAYETCEKTKPVTTCTSSTGKTSKASSPDSSASSQASASRLVSEAR